MQRTFNTYRGHRAGKVAVLVAIMLPTVLIPLLAIGVDGGMLMEVRRQLQSAVDAAALSAAVELYRSNPTHAGNSVQPSATATAQTAALDALDTHGFPSAKCQVRTVNLPATSTNPRINGKPGTVEVVVTYLQPRSFSKLWGTADLPVTARAVARVREFSQGNGVIVLEKTDSKALWATGNGMLVVNEGGVMVNSTSSAAATTSGGNSVLAGTSFDIVGGVAGSNFYLSPYPASGPAQPYTNSVPVSDPLADLPEPNPADYPVQIAPPNAGPANGTITLQPGRYTTRLSYSGPRTIALSPGIYYLEKGISLSGQAQLTGTNVMLYNTGSGSSNGIDLTGQGVWSLSPPQSGTYQGISIFQSRNTADTSTPTKLAGNGGSGVTGTIYTPTTPTTLSGNGTQVLGSQFIGRTLEMSGNGNFTINYPSEKAPQPPVIELVE